MQVGKADILVFTSVNAVTFFPKAYLDKLRARTALQPALIAVGPSTQKALEEQGLTLAAESTPPFNSEALLELPFLQRVHQKEIVIVTGEGGRTHLAEALQKKGALVSFLEVYRRQESEGDLLDFWKEYSPEIILTTSNEILQAVYDRMRDKPLLLKTPLIVTSTRALHLAEQLGFGVILTTPFYHEEQLIKTIAEYRNAKR